MTKTGKVEGSRPFVQVSQLTLQVRTGLSLLMNDPAGRAATRRCPRRAAALGRWGGRPTGLPRCKLEDVTEQVCVARTSWLRVTAEGSPCWGLGVLQASLSPFLCPHPLPQPLPRRCFRQHGQCADLGLKGKVQELEKA